MVVLGMYAAMLGSTYKRIQYERAAGQLVMLCPRCGRWVSETELALVNGELMCVGHVSEACCALWERADGGDSSVAIAAAWQELKSKMERFSRGDLSYADMGVARQVEGEEQDAERPNSVRPRD